MQAVEKYFAGWERDTSGKKRETRIAKSERISNYKTQITKDKQIR
jgi:hypothetical protein